MGRGKSFFLIGFLYSLGFYFPKFSWIRIRWFPICKVVFDWFKKKFEKFEFRSELPYFRSKISIEKKLGSWLIWEEEWKLPLFKGPYIGIEVQSIWEKEILFLINILYSLGFLFLSFLRLGFIDFPICKIIFDWLKKRRKNNQSKNSLFHSKQFLDTVQIYKINMVHKSTVR